VASGVKESAPIKFEAFTAKNETSGYLGLIAPLLPLLEKDIRDYIQSILFGFQNHIDEKNITSDYDTAFSKYLHSIPPIPGLDSFNYDINTGTLFLTTIKEEESLKVAAKVNFGETLKIFSKKENRLNKIEIPKSELRGDTIINDDNTIHVPPDTSNQIGSPKVSATPVVVPVTPTTNFESITLEGYDNGINIHLKFSVSNFQKELIAVRAKFYDNLTNKHILNSNSVIFSTSNSGKKSIFDETISIPYRDLNLSAGKYKLKIEVSNGNKRIGILSPSKTFTLE